jgi:hypothetical protein
LVLFYSYLVAGCPAPFRRGRIEYLGHPTQHLPFLHRSLEYP